MVDCSPQRLISVSQPTIAYSFLQIKKRGLSLAGVAQWVERWTANQSIAGLIPNQGTCLGCRPGPQ